MTDQRMTFSVHDLPCNDLHLNPIALPIVNALLCGNCYGSGKDIIKWDDDGSWDRYDCTRCTDHPGIDPDVIQKVHDDLCCHLRDDDGCPVYVVSSIPVTHES